LWYPRWYPLGITRKNFKLEQVFTLKLYLTPNDWSCHSCVKRHFEISYNIIELEKRGYLLAHHFDAFLLWEGGKGFRAQTFL
jgi:hypothetical protein